MICGLLVGDAVLGVVASQLVFEAHPNSSTGVLNDEKTKLVKSFTLILFLSP